MQVYSEKVNHAVLPGDVIGSLDEKLASTLQQSSIVKIGHGLLQLESNIIATKAGLLRFIPPNRYFVENNQHRYVPMVGDMVIGVVKDKVPVEQYSVDIFAHQGLALLPFIGFDGATRRNRPDLGPGSLVYGRVTLANKDLDLEITCESSPGMKKKDWSTGKSVFGELKGGYVTECSLGMARKLLDPNCYLLKLLSEHVSFEIAIGLNGRVWINSEAPNDIVLICNAIQNSEHLTQDQVQQMLTFLFKSKKKTK
ncbi:predicted protein [Naegleria gruberi]|uniref:Predicted protein n=1 Tax=Naegleria gruberi TaxID=5762 RepID=D2VXB4_NAEGR|nr:uncharacterized protein NAEGRDRAFT_81583 [Naegleria gruberi]EFC38600.1 predicted protein [Naegleria gruberi]|eukprot:XP_002671344.1 predicted protein [Naegleria gruberi strain NEG-M]